MKLIIYNTFQHFQTLWSFIIRQQKNSPASFDSPKRQNHNLRNIAVFLFFYFIVIILNNIYLYLVYVEKMYINLIPKATADLMIISLLQYKSVFMIRGFFVNFVPPKAINTQNTPIFAIVIKQQQWNTMVEFTQILFVV